MENILIRNAHLILDESNEIEKTDILIKNGIIEKIGVTENFNGKVIDADGKIVMPGMIDVHIHGASGYDFTTADQQGLDKIAENLVKDGVTGFLGSLTVLSHEKMMQLLNRYAHMSQPENGAVFHGLHSEGPYISMKYKAVMNPLNIRPYNEDEFKEMLSVKEGLIRTMTFSPSIEGADDLLANGCENELIMMIGHTDATCAQAKEAVKNGASGFTHLYNAMSPHTHRNTGCVTAAFITDGFCELIADTIHVESDVLKMTYNAIGSKRIILITDAMNAKSLPDGMYEFSDKIIEKKNGKAYVPETGRLAGSCACLNECVRNMKNITGAAYPQLVEMACVNPAKLLHCDDHKGRIREGYDADIVIMDQNFNCVFTMVEGKICHNCL